MLKTSPSAQLQVAIIALLALIFGVFSPASPAYAAHFISVEADVAVLTDSSNRPVAELTLTHKWTSSGAFSPQVRNPDGTLISPTVLVNGSSATQVKDSNNVNIPGVFRQVYRYDLTGLTLSGIYTISGSSCCGITSFNTNQGNFSFEVSFSYNPASPSLFGGSPRFTSALLTTIATGNDFSQNLGGSSRNGLPVRYSFVTDPAQNGVVVPAGITLSQAGVLSIPGSTTTAIRQTHSKFGLKLLLEELDGATVVGSVTRDIGYDLVVGSPPTVSAQDSDGNALSNGAAVSMGAGTTKTIILTSTGSVTPVFTTSNLPSSGATSWIGAGSEEVTSGTTRTWTLILAPPGVTSAQTRPIEFVSTASGLATSFTLTVTITPARPLVDSIGDGELGVSWVAAEGDNLLGYQLRYQLEGSGSWALAPQVLAGTTSQTVAGLINGASYVFQVASVTQADGQPAGTANNLTDGDYSPSSTAAVPGRPTNLVPPSILPSSGVGVGSVLTATDLNASWMNPLGPVGNLVVSFQWQRGGVDITGATAGTYTAVTADIGQQLRVVATRSNVAGGSSASSQQISAVLPRAALTGLSTSIGLLSPAFDPEILVYTLAAPGGSTSMTFTPVFANSELVTVQGDSVVSGSASGAVSLAAGNTVVRVVVSTGSSAVSTIRITVNVPPAGQASSAPSRGPTIGGPPALSPAPRVLPRLLPAPPPASGIVVQNNRVPVAPSQPTAVVGGRSVTLETEVTGSTDVSMRAGSFSMGMNVQPEQGSVRQQAGTTEIQVRNGGWAAVSGTGLLPQSMVQVFMPLAGGGSREISRIPVDGAGVFSGDAIFGATPSERPMPIGRQLLQVVTVDENRQQTVVEMTVNIAQAAPAPEPDRIQGAPPTLRPGQSIATNAGEPEIVTVTPNSDQKQATVKGDGWSMGLQVQGEDGGVDPGNNGGASVTFVRNQSALVSGEGFMPGTRADVWLFSDPTLLGSVQIDDTGAFSGEVNIDGAVVTVGEHTLQLQGVGEDGFVRAANLGVTVEDAAAEVTTEAATGFLWWLWLLVALGVAAVVGGTAWFRRAAR